MYDLTREKKLQAIKDAATDVNERIFRLTVLAMLVIGAAAPMFRIDDVAKYVAGICIIALAVMAAFTLFRRRSP